MNELLVMMPMFYLMNQIDWTVENNVLMARIGYGVVQVLSLVVYGYIYSIITAKKETKKIKVPKAPTGFGATSTETEEMTICEYDFSQVKKALTQVLIGIAIVSFLHVKWNMVQPLFLQCFMTPMQIYKNPLVKLFILGEKIDRPFKEESPFAGLLPKPEETADTNSQVTSTSDDSDDDKPRVELLEDNVEEEELKREKQQSQVKEKGEKPAQQRKKTKRDNY